MASRSNPASAGPPSRKNLTNGRTAKYCKECGSGSKRNVVPKSGGRCATHWRAEKKRRREVAQERRWQNVYGITRSEYEQIKASKGGVCAICQRANGRSKALAVDHDHQTGYVRGICCGTCNKTILGHSRDDPEFFRRAIEYLESPPAFAVIGQRAVPNHEGVASA